MAGPALTANEVPKEPALSAQPGAVLVARSKVKKKTDAPRTALEEAEEAQELKREREDPPTKEEPALSANDSVASAVGTKRARKEKNEPALSANEPSAAASSSDAASSSAAASSMPALPAPAPVLLFPGMSDFFVAESNDDGMEQEETKTKAGRCATKPFKFIDIDFDIIFRLDGPRLNLMFSELVQPNVKPASARLVRLMGSDWGPAWARALDKRLA